MRTMDRRSFMETIGKPMAAAAAVAVIEPTLMNRALASVRGIKGDPSDIAKDESFWFEIQQAYTADRGLINLNNGGVSPSPAVVQEAMKRHLDFSNTSPAYSMWRILEPQREPVRRRLARFHGCDAEEIALTRNASEGLQICQNGFDFEPGDEASSREDFGLDEALSRSSGSAVAAVESWLDWVEGGIGTSWAVAGEKDDLWAPGIIYLA